MGSRLPDPPVFKSEPTEIAAERFNRVRLALSRLGGPLLERFGVRGLEFRVDRRAWVCRDLQREQAPLLAWTDFTVRRQTLHQPVACRLVLYSAYGGLLAYNALEELDRRIAHRLAEQAPGRGARIVAHPAGRRRY
jgi:hypothetical protein